MLTVEVGTATGSTYWVTELDDGTYRFAADNVPNPNSPRMDPSEWWEIERPEPWPPVSGRRLMLAAPRDMDMDDPDRAPGGGKYTSVVTGWREVEA